MPVFKLMFLLQWRSGETKAPADSNGAKAEKLERAPHAEDKKTGAARLEMASAPCSVLPRPPGAPARANFGTLKRRPFGRNPVRR